MNVTIIGAGPLGRWLALAAARAGFSVFLEDVMPANLHHAREVMRQQLGAELLHAAADAAPLVSFVSTVEDAVREADLVIDCVPDELESKLEIFCLIDRMAPPRTIIATPTTRLSIADLAACTYRADKCVAIVAEASALTAREQEGGFDDLLLRTGPLTTPQTVDVVEKFWRGVGFAPRVEPDAAS
ncbi:MAG TPA: 3-hydroxyacyl-CoA dehydrogenase NAD-binding domain-containing protein [Terracidiphilus sp.]|nr:3-hydroxyacyl-CoA dehydrogenase NAD-binding domain-containing protein [Terracidiphilus sp.]